MEKVRGPVLLFILCVSLILSDVGSCKEYLKNRYSLLNTDNKTLRLVFDPSVISNDGNYF